MSYKLQSGKNRLRRLPVVNSSGVLVHVKELGHSDREVEHRKMRQTWLQTFIGFLTLSAMLGCVAWYFGGINLLGAFGILMLAAVALSWFFSARIAPMAVQAYKADPNTPHGAAAIRCADRAWQLLQNHVRKYYGEGLVKLLRRPPVMLSPNKHANAFCTGRDWNDSVIVIFEGLFLAEMDDDEIVAVLCHELGHYFHLDVFTQSIASVLGSLMSLTVAGAARRSVSGFFSRLPRWMSWFSWLSYVALLFSLRITGVFTKVVQMFISRSREASADAFSAELTDDPCALARALKKLVAYELGLASRQEEEQARQKAQDPVKFRAESILRLCEESLLDSLGLMLFVDTLETLDRPQGHSPNVSCLRKVWERLMENHPPVDERCSWLELAAGHACPLPAWTSAFKS